MPNEINDLQEQMNNEAEVNSSKESETELVETRGLEFDELKPCGDYFQTAKASSTGSDW